MPLVFVTEDDEDVFLSKSKNELLLDRIFDIVGPFESATEVEATFL